MWDRWGSSPLASYVSIGKTLLFFSSYFKIFFKLFFISYNYLSQRFSHSEFHGFLFAEHNHRLLGFSALTKSNDLLGKIFYC